MHYNLALIGFGNVARPLARLLLRKQELLQSQYDITFAFTGISTGRHGCAVNPGGLNIEEALSLVESGKSVFPLSAFHFYLCLHPQSPCFFTSSILIA